MQTRTIYTHHAHTHTHTYLLLYFSQAITSSAKCFNCRNIATIIPIHNHTFIPTPNINLEYIKAGAVSKLQSHSVKAESNEHMRKKNRFKTAANLAVAANKIHR